MTTRLKKVLVLATTILSVALIIVSLSSPTTALADEDLATAYLTGTFSEVAYDDILALVNTYRQEAIDKGYAQALFNYSGDFVTMQWNADLETIARERAIDNLITFAHTRPDGSSCFTVTSNGVSSSNEIIASPSDILSSVKLWYSEIDYITLDGSGGYTASGEIGHYKALVNPYNVFIGIAGISGTGYCTDGASVGECSQNTNLTASNLANADLSATATRQVQKSLIANINSVQSSITNNTLPAESTGSLFAVASMTTTFGTRTASIISGLEWASSNTSVATVNDGTVTGVSYGSATFTAKSPTGGSSATSASIKIIYKDVTDSSLSYYKTVYWAADNKITTCKSSFGITSTCTRSQMVIFLYRLARLLGANMHYNKSEECPFTDVSQSDSCYKPVMWAYQHGITTGTSSTTFSPSSNCSRGQMIIFLYRLARYVDADVSIKSSTVLPFTDVSSSMSYYRPLLWAYQNRITTGTSTTTYSPSSSLTRKQMVIFLYRLNRYAS